MSNVLGQGSVDTTLSEQDVRPLLHQAFDDAPLDGQRVLVIIPDGTRLCQTA